LKRKVSLALTALCCLVLLAGCGTMKTKWRETKKLYREYVNVDPTIDFSAQGISDKGLQRLAALFMPVDERLMGLLRTLGSQDTPPEQEWCQQVLTSNDWLSGVAVVNASGSVQFQSPAVPLRPLDFAGLLEFADRYKTRKFGAQIKTDEFGTVVMVAAPFFKNNEWAGLIVTYFDPRNLLRFSPDANALVVVSTDGLVWPGGNGQGEVLAGLKWAEILKGSVQGEIAAAGSQYLWVARYLGQLELVYLTDARDVRAQQPNPASKPTPEAAPTATAPTNP